MNLKQQIEIMEKHDLVIARVIMRERASGKDTMEIEFKKEVEDGKTTPNS